MKFMTQDEPHQWLNEVIARRPGQRRRRSERALNQLLPVPDRYQP